MKISLLIAALFFVTIKVFSQTMPPVEKGVSPALAKWRAANYSDIRCKLDITLEKQSPTLKGTMEIRLNVSVPPASAGERNAAIVLDWRKIKGKEKLSAVSNVFVNGKPAKLAAGATAKNVGADLRFAEINEHLIFKEGVKTGENVIKLDFTSPIAASGAAVMRIVDKTDGAEYVYSLFVPSNTSTAFPIFDQSDLKARFTFSAAIPQGWKIVANGAFKEEIQTSGIGAAGKSIARQIFFGETEPIGTYGFAFAAGDFYRFSEADFLSAKDKAAAAAEILNRRFPDVYVRRSQAGKFKQRAAETFRLIREGEKSRISKLDIVLLPDLSNAQAVYENLKFVRESAVFR
jgi:aminopeptidase N